MQRKTPLHRSTLILTMLVGLMALSVGSAWADAMTPAKAFELSGQGGVAFQIPAWKESGVARADVAVFEHDARTKGGDDFYLLMVTIEAGPTGTGKVDWEGIRANIANEAKKNKADVGLKLDGEFKSAAGFRGQKMSGTIATKAHTMTVALVALVQSGKLVTVSVVSGKAGAGAKLAADVANTSKLKK